MNTLERLHQLVHGMFGTGTITANAIESGGVQRMQVNLHGAASATTDPVPSLQTVGVASSPMPGARVAVIHLGGDRSKPVIVATDDPRHRPADLAPGETKLYGASGAFVHIDAGGSIVITPFGGAPVTINGDLHVTGEIIGGFGTGDAVTVTQHQHQASGVTTPPTAGT